MSKGHESDRSKPRLSPEQLVAMKASAGTLRMMQKILRPLGSNEQATPALIDSYGRVIRQGKTKLWVVAIAYHHKPAGPLKDQVTYEVPEPYKDLNVALRGRIDVRDAANPKTHQMPKLKTQYDFWEVAETSPALDGLALIIGDRQAYFQEGQPTSSDDMNDIARIIGNHIFKNKNTANLDEALYDFTMAERGPAATADGYKSVGDTFIADRHLARELSDHLLAWEVESALQDMGL